MTFFLFRLKIEAFSLETNFILFLVSSGIICGPRRESFAVRDPLRFNLGVIFRQETICGAKQGTPLVFFI